MPRPTDCLVYNVLQTAQVPRPTMQQHVNVQVQCRSTAADSRSPSAKFKRPVQRQSWENASDHGLYYCWNTLSPHSAVVCLHDCTCTLYQYSRECGVNRVFRCKQGAVKDREATRHTFSWVDPRLKGSGSVSFLPRILKPHMIAIVVVFSFLVRIEVP